MLVHYKDLCHSAAALLPAASASPSVVAASSACCTTHFMIFVQVLAQVEEGSAHELAFSMLLSLALIPAAQQVVADQGEVQSLVKVRLLEQHSDFLVDF